LWLLEELSVRYELKTFKRGKDKLAPEELRKIHPLGKSPIVAVHGPNATEPTILAESAAIVEYLIDHFGKQMIPTRYKAGQEDVLGGETEEWLRYRYYMHYAEGSIMPLMLIALVIGGRCANVAGSNEERLKARTELRNAPVPFFVKWITRAIADRVDQTFLNPQFKLQLDFLEQQLASSPRNGEFFAGPTLTGADIMMIFPLEAGGNRAGITPDKYPRLTAFVERIQSRDAYKRAIKRVEEATGEKYSMKFD
jgi:glutathione S-transferase